MVYLKTEKLPEINGKCVMIGQAAVPFEPFLYQEKVPVTLSGETIYNVNGTEGKTITPIVFNIVASDGSDVSYALSSGTIPNGITLTGKSISGTPNVSGDFSATVTATSGDVSLEILINFFLENPVVEKYPHNLTSNTSDPDWELSGASQNDSLYKAFDSNPDTYFTFQMSSESGTQVAGVAIQWVRTDGKEFSVSSVTMLYGITADGDEIELAPKTTSGTHTINVDSDELVSGIKVFMDGNYGTIHISEITVS